MLVKLTELQIGSWLCADGHIVQLTHLKPNLYVFAGKTEGKKAYRANTMSKSVIPIIPTEHTMHLIGYEILINHEEKKVYNKVDGGRTNHFWSYGKNEKGLYVWEYCKKQLSPSGELACRYHHNPSIQYIHQMQLVETIFNL